MTTSIIYVAADLLDPHPGLDRLMLVPRVAEAIQENARSHKDRVERVEAISESWFAWVEELRTNGVLEPLRIVKRTDSPGYWIADGRHRHAGGIEAGIEKFPAIVVKESDVLPLALATVVGRRHMTKSQRAWLAVLMHPEVASDDRKPGRPSKSLIKKGIKNEDLAVRVGVSLSLIESAVKLYRLLDQYPDFRVRIEPGLHAGVKLQDCLNGLNALVMGTTGPGITHPKIPTGRFSTAWKHESAAAAKWAALTEENRIVLTNDLKSAAKDLPADYLDWKMDILADVLAEMRKAEADADAAVPAALSED